MVIRCSVCRKIKKFDKWIAVPQSLEEELKEVSVLHVTCEDCRKEASTKKSVLNSLEHKMVCF